ncbi:MAG: phospholipase effector Tle1 domain-containing protein, partial [Geminicoccaceae bacterium]
MSKRIVILSDGTWNDGSESETNIHWLKENLLDIPGQQLVHYDKGVGTEWFNDKSGGAFGVGLSRNIRQLYEVILNHYEPGDDLYCLGFSRGAYTVRSLCGFLSLVGRVGSASEIDEAYTYYRLHEPGEDDNVVERLFEPTSRGPVAIRFLGVFDTVGALGLPIEISDDAAALRGSFLSRARSAFLEWFDGLGDRLRRPIKGFHDTRLGSHVEEGYHALAIDEQRQSFAPTLWTNA